MDMKPTVERHWKESSAKLGQFIRSRVEDPTAAEDILQEVFLKLQSRLDDLHDPAKVGISISGAKSRVQRGREQLKELLLDFCEREFRHTPGSQPCPHGLLPPVTGKWNPRKRT